MFGVNANNVVFQCTGITELNPSGSGFRVVTRFGSFVTTGLNGQYLLVRGAIFESLQGIYIKCYGPKSVRIRLCCRNSFHKQAL